MIQKAYPREARSFLPASTAGSCHRIQRSAAVVQRETDRKQAGCAMAPAASPSTFLDRNFIGGWLRTLRKAPPDRCCRSTVRTRRSRRRCRGKSVKPSKPNGAKFEMLSSMHCPFARKRAGGGDASEG